MFLEKKVSLYLVLLFLFLGSICSILFGAAVRHVLLAPESRLGAFGELALTVAEFPHLVKEVVASAPSAQILIPGRFTEKDGFKINGKLPAGVFEDDGYLLLTSYDVSKGQSTIQLIQINTQKTLHEWVPDIDELNELNILSEKWSADYTAKTHFRMFHPLPVNGADLIFNAGTGLYRMDICAKNQMFVDGTFHHSNELDHEGNVWVPSVKYPHSFEQLQEYRDDTIAKLSQNGEILFEKSIAEMLVENGYQGLLAVGHDDDPIHINDIQPAMSDSEFWLKGDLLMSLRNRSTVMLYRPSTNKILWLKTGPWMNQHDMNFVDEHTISIFGNDVIDVDIKRAFLNGHNNVYLYDFKTDQVSEPYKKIMKEADVRTITEGRGTPLPGGDLFIEESNNGRTLRVSTNEVKWEYVRRIDEDAVAMTSWSRYLSPKEAAPMLAKLGGNLCD